jgi:hypothetical protein
MSAHTPGPWRSEFGNNRAFVISKVDIEVAEVHILRSTNKEEDGNREVMVANARLIAAAPELLELAVDQLARLKANGFGDSDRADRLRYVIAKAVGR